MPFRSPLRTIVWLTLKMYTNITYRILRWNSPSIAPNYKFYKTNSINGWKLTATTQIYMYWIVSSSTFSFIYNSVCLNVEHIYLWVCVCLCKCACACGWRTHQRRFICHLHTNMCVICSHAYTHLYHLANNYIFIDWIK